jgi:uncharacterized membrane protein
MPTLTGFGASLLAFIVLDGIWLGVVMKNFYVTQLQAIGRIVDGSLMPVWPVAVLVYPLLALGIDVFVLPRAQAMQQAGLLGALFGLVVYGVYDLTNYATLAGWPAIVTVVDIAWGTTACAASAAFARAMSSR